MDNDRTKGIAKQAKGNVKEWLGKVTGNKKLETDGKVDKVKGTVQKSVGEAKDSARKI